MIKPVNTPPAFALLLSRRGVLRLALAMALLLLMLAPVAHAQGPMPPPIAAERAAKEGMIWGGLIFASDVPPPERRPPPGEFPDLPRRLAHVFPYQHYEVLGEHNQVIFRQYESWVVPSKDLFLKVDSKGIAEHGGINVHLQFWQGQQVLVKTDAVLRPNSPLFIAGPRWRHGRLIFVVELRRLEPRPRP
jgi:hypothetical protein